MRSALKIEERYEVSGGYLYLDLFKTKSNSDYLLI